MVAVQAHGKQTTTKRPDVLAQDLQKQQELKKGKRANFTIGTGANVFPRPHNLGRSGESADSRPGCGRKERMANTTEIFGYLRPTKTAATRRPGHLLPADAVGPRTPAAPAMTSGDGTGITSP